MLRRKLKQTTRAAASKLKRDNGSHTDGVNTRADSDGAATDR